MRILSTIEQLFYKIRDFFWNYPDYLIGEYSIKNFILYIYNLTIPYSHFVLGFLIIFLVFIFAFTNNHKSLISANSNKLIEGVVMGTDDQGRTQRLNQVNPIIPSNVQLEKDLVDLIYEPLIKYEYNQKPDGSWSPIIKQYLADEVILIKAGADYQFELKKGIRWHDGAEFTADDVVATFDLISSQAEDTNAYVHAIKQLRWEEIDKYTIRICTKAAESESSCNETKDKPIFSNFLELISVKIVPKHKIGDIDKRTIKTAIPDLYRLPVGTGKYKFFGTDDFSVKLVKNEKYYEKSSVPKIDTLEFKFYKSLEDAVKALQNGEVHSIVSTSVQYLKELKDYPQINQNYSPVQYNQYWGMYFNMRYKPTKIPAEKQKLENNGEVVDPDREYIGPSFFGDVNVRQAISMSINRGEIVGNALQGLGEESYGPIPKISEYFNKNIKWLTYNPEKARELLDAAGWNLEPGKLYRINKKGEEMKFSLYFVNSFDRSNIARSIKEDLAKIGINVVIDRREEPGQDDSEFAPSGWSLQELNDQIVAPRSFDALLYGMSTFIDPDRFELFHSSQKDAPKLNIASYIGSVGTREINPNRTGNNDSLIAVPKLDRWLKEARSFDPEKHKDDRKSHYNVIQELISNDAPLVFLFHPQFVYFTNSSVKNVDMSNVFGVEDRFRNIEKWEMR